MLLPPEAAGAERRRSTPAPRPLGLPERRAGWRGSPIRIGLLNNMPGKAFAATERQFRRVLASPGAPAVDLRLFALDMLPRDAEHQAAVDRAYASHRAIPTARLDALIVTGCEPGPGPLDAEPWFEDFANLVDWAGDETVSTVFSCLAAQAAVLHLDRIKRRRLPVKAWGVFPCRTLARHPLLHRSAAITHVPHSRWNDLPEDELVDAGYTILRRSDAVGVDLFVRDEGSLFVFCQGHPEYDAESLAREHRRDFGRFLAGEREDAPPLPANYFSDEASVALGVFAEHAARDRRPELLDAMPGVDAAPPLLHAWQSAASRLMRNWLDEVERRRSARFDRIHARVAPRIEAPRSLA